MNIKNELKIKEKLTKSKNSRNKYENKTSKKSYKDFYYKMFNNIERKKHFYRPLVKSFDGHSDSILCVKRHPRNSSLFISGSTDGQLKFWIINRKFHINSIQAHTCFIRDIAIHNSGLYMLTSSDDYYIKLWNISELENKPKKIFKANFVFNSLTFHNFSNLFLTGGKEILLWDLEKFKPIQKLVYGINSVSKITFNPFEHNILVACSSDRSILLFDLRLKSSVNKISMQMPSNDVSWSNIESSEFIIANEDSNIYTFDIRNLHKVIKIHNGHVMPVLSVDQNPKFPNFVSGSSDNTIRFFYKDSHNSRETLFTQRMRRVLDVCFTLDGQYIISASDDGELRLWENVDFKQKCNSLVYLSNLRTRKNSYLIKNNKELYTRKPIPNNIRKMLYIRTKIIKKNQKNIENRNTLPGYINFKMK